MKPIYSSDGVDISLFNSAYQSNLKLICGNNTELFNRLEKQFDEYEDQIKILDFENSIVSKGVPGLTAIGYDRDKVNLNDPNFLFNFRLYIYDDKNYNDIRNKNNLLLTETHELMHVFTGLCPFIGLNSNIYEYNGIKHYNKNGHIGFLDENENFNIGVMFNETLTEMTSLASVSYFNKNYTGKRVNANDIFKNPTSLNDVLESKYKFYLSLTKLALAAFSNNPDEDFDKIIKDGGSIFNNTFKTRNNRVLYSNDLLYGYLNNPLHIKEKFEEIYGFGTYDYLARGLDYSFENVIKNDEYYFDDIKAYMYILPDFLNKKVDLYKRMGRFNEQDGNKIISNFNKIWNTMQVEYNVYFNQNEINNFHFYKSLKHLNKLPYEKK